MYHFDYIQSINTRISGITLPNWTCNDPTFVTLNISQAMLIESIEIGDNCFGMVNSFRIDG